MRLKELFDIEDNHIFNYMENEHGELYNSLFNGVNSDVWDFYTMCKFGERSLIPVLCERNMFQFLDGVFLQYGEGWVKTHNLLNLNYNPIEVKTVENITGEGSNKVENDVTDTGSNKAFNSTEFIPTDKSNTSSEQNTTNDHQSTKEVIKQPTDTTNKVMGELNMRLKFQMFTIVLETIINQITLNIYE